MDRRLAVVDPATIAPIAEFGVAHLQRASQVGQPPLARPQQFVVARYLANGKLDTAFGTGGFAQSNFASPALG